VGDAVTRYDVVIIGTGAGGGTLARVLAPSGKRVLLLERGDWLPREPQNWSTADVFVDNRYISPDTCRANELDNLYVVDTSFFPSIGAVNPALTAATNAIRVGEHLLGRLGASTPTEAARAVPAR
jgi:choline dehydrogenase-like flavoprotein